MAKVRIKGLKGQRKKTIAKAKKLADIALRDQKTANVIKNMLLLPIKKKGILPSGNRAKSVSDAWRKRRRKLAEFNKVSKYASEWLSNLSFSGRFLSSFKIFVSARKKVIYLITPTGSHRGYKGVKGKRGKTVDNAVIGQGLVESGRDYTVISEENKAKIAKKLIGRIRRELKLKLNL